eukprot:TRINITY_DN4990_c0_g1_i2.p1 TRINITY_DN4990_c0_g1~~TRINITY_DN4990_c0_g1_i2.p1  ORF type:complete len:750 (-),score=156.30 TRINITY_DN4990_c0_g1_i2:290-2482(-)
MVWHRAAIVSMVLQPHAVVADLNSLMNQAASTANNEIAPSVAGLTSSAGGDRPVIITTTFAASSGGSVLAGIAAAAQATKDNSCVKYSCGADYKPDNPCQCNDHCESYGNCCDDYASFCKSGAESSVKEAVEQASSKAATCALYGCDAEYKPENPCQCNDHCESYGNCCDDYSITCKAAETSSALSTRAESAQKSITDLGSMAANKLNTATQDVQENVANAAKSSVSSTVQEAEAGVDNAIAAAQTAAPGVQETVANAVESSVPSTVQEAQASVENAIAAAQTAAPAVQETVANAEAAASNAASSMSTGMENAKYGAIAALSSLAAIDNACTEKVKSAAEKLASCASSADQLCACVAKFNTTVAACDDSKVGSLLMSQTLQKQKGSENCLPDVLREGSAVYNEIEGSLKLFVQDSAAFEALKGKTAAVEDAISKIAGVLPEEVSAILYPEAAASNTESTISRRLQGTAATWSADYTITSSVMNDPQQIVQKVDATDATTLQNNLAASFQSKAGSVPAMTAQSLPAALNEIAQAVQAQTSSSSAPSEVLSSTTEAPEGASIWENILFYALILGFIALLAGVAYIAWKVCTDKAKPAKKRRALATSAPLVSNVNASSARAAGPPLMQAPAVNYPAQMPTVPTLSAPLPTYTTARQGMSYVPAAPVTYLGGQPAQVADRSFAYAPAPSTIAAFPQQQSIADVAARASALFDALDVNHDGSVSRAELEAFMQRR